MHYVTRICHQMQKHKFNVTRADALFFEAAQVPPEHETLCVDVLRRRGGNALCDPQIPPDAKTQVYDKLSRSIFVESIVVPHMQEI
jgi:hypothetical protein